MNPIDPTANERDSEHYESLLGAAAFGTLDAGEEAELRAYLAASPRARAELAEMRLIVGNLPLLADEMDPPPALRERIEAALRSATRPEQTWPAAPAPIRPRETGAAPGEMQPLDFTAQPSASRRRRAPNWRNYVLAAAAALLIAVFAGVVLDRLVLQDDDDRETIAYNLNLPAAPAGLSADLTYDPEQQLFVLETENMPPAPEGQIYQIWLINEDGAKPAGVMDEPTFAVAADKSRYDEFAITVEPGPIGSPGPTTTPFFVAELAPAGDE